MRSNIHTPLFGIYMNKFFNFLYSLLFTRDDDLDILQILFAAIVIVALIITWYVAIPSINAANVRIEAFITLRWLAGLLVVTAVPKWLVPFIVKQAPVETPTQHASEDTSTEEE